MAACWFVLLALVMPSAGVAQTIAVAPPAGLVGVRVSGRAVATPGTEGAEDMVQLQSMGGQVRLFQVPVRPGQSFALDGVPPGTYRLSLRRYHGFAYKTVVVGREPVRDLELTFIRLIDVPVTIDVDDGPPPAGVGYHAVLAGNNLRGFLSPEGGLSLPPGTIRLFVRPPAAYFVTSFRAGRTDLLREPMELTAGQASPTLSLSLTKTRTSPAPTSTLNGRLTGGQSDLEVLLYDITGIPQSSSQIVSRATTDAVGRFSLPGVPPGVYTLHVPPARDVVPTVVVLGEPAALTVEIPPGSVVASNAPRVTDSAGVMSPRWPDELVFVATSGSATTKIPVPRQGFWSAMMPGVYAVRLEGLSSEFRVKSITAGSADLMKGPLVVPEGRPAEAVSIELEITARPAVR